MACRGTFAATTGPELIATRLKTWLEGFGVDHEHIKPGKPQLQDGQNGHVESFNSRLRDELLAGELLPTLTEARWLLERWQLDDNHHPPHSALGYTTPAAYAAGLKRVGTLDDNVHMQNSIKLIDALTRAGKPFDVFFYPGFRHGLGSPHYQRLTWDFMLEQMRPTPPGPPGADQTPEPSQSPAAQPGVAGPR